MDTTRDHMVTEYEQHEFDMLLWQADVHERTGRERETFEIRAWVADFLSRHCAFGHTTHPSAVNSLKQNEKRI